MLFRNNIFTLTACKILFSTLLNEQNKQKYFCVFYRLSVTEQNSALKNVNINSDTAGGIVQRFQTKKIYSEKSYQSVSRFYYIAGGMKRFV